MVVFIQLIHNLRLVYLEQIVDGLCYLDAMRFVHKGNNDINMQTISML